MTTRAQTRAAGTERLRSFSRDPHTTRAAELAIAQMAANVFALVATIIFARKLGTADYGQLARMLSVFTILLVPATALQAATARETALGHLGTPAETFATLQRWLKRVMVAAGVTLLVCILLRNQLADLMQVSVPWAAALVLPSGIVWSGIALQRGVLQGMANYRLVGISLVAEQLFRLGFGLAAVLAGGQITGMFICSVPLAFLPVLVMLWWQTYRLVGPPDRSAPDSPLLALARRNPVAVAALTLFAVIQNADVVAVGHFFVPRVSGAYAEAAVAAKGIIWLAVGLGLYLLPEATREAAMGKDARHLLMRALGMLAVVAVPMVIVYTAFSSQLLNAIFGDKATLATDALPWLAVAMSFLSVAYLAIQLSLALGHRRFVWLVAVQAALMPLTVALAQDSLESVAIALTVLDGLFAAAMVILAVRKPLTAKHLDVEAAESFAAAEATAAAESAIP